MRALILQSSGCGLALLLPGAAFSGVKTHVPSPLSFATLSLRSRAPRLTPRKQPSAGPGAEAHRDRMSGPGRFCCRSRPLCRAVGGLFALDLEAFYAPAPLRGAQSLSGRRSCNQRCKPLQILSDGRQHELILGASGAAQSKPIEPQNALQVGEPHLDLLTLAPRLLEAFGAGE